MLDRGERALRIILEDLAGKASRDAPVAEGTLRASADVEVHRNDTLGILEGTVSFNTVYAARQHEETEWEHPKGGRAKYLEHNLKADQSRYDRIIALAMRGAF